MRDASRFYHIPAKIISPGGRTTEVIVIDGLVLERETTQKSVVSIENKIYTTLSDPITVDGPCVAGDTAIATITLNSLTRRISSVAFISCNGGKTEVRFDSSLSWIHTHYFSEGERFSYVGANPELPPESVSERDKVFQELDRLIRAGAGDTPRARPDGTPFRSYVKKPGPKGKH
jgi:hypothetical protein